MKRRDLLKGLLAGGAAAGGMLLDSPLRLRMRRAEAAPNLPALVIVFQRGGCDGVNVVVPHTEQAYYDARPSIAIARPDDTSVPENERAMDLDGQFGLHPAMTGMKSLWDQGTLAIMPTVQYPSPSRSHFDSQHYIESAIRSDDYDGWLNRHLATTSAPGSMRAVHFGSSLPQSLRGQVPVANFTSIDNYHLGLEDADDEQLVNHVLPVYQQPLSSPSAYRELVQTFGQVLFGTLEVARNIDTGSYEPANGAAYPNSGFGRQLRQVAQLLKDPSVELELASVNIGGWDTHSDQGAGEADGRQSRRLKDLSDGVAALHQDLGSLMENVVVLVMTEFGRTFKENGSRGTDHGIASSWFALGGGVQQGIYMGPQGWPGLAPDQLLSERFLAWTVDYRDIMGDILQDHLSNGDLATLLPGHSYTPLGLFGAA